MQASSSFRKEGKTALASYRNFIVIASKKSMYSLLKSDVGRIYAERIGFRTLLRAAANPSVRAALLIRLAVLENVVLRVFARNALISFFGIDVGKGAKIGTGLYLPHPVCIVIGEGAVLGDDITLYHGVTLGKLKGEYPTIGHRSTLYPHATVIGKVAIGTDTSVPPGTIIRPDESDR